MSLITLPLSKSYSCIDPAIYWVSVYFLLLLVTKKLHKTFHVVFGTTFMSQVHWNLLWFVLDNFAYMLHQKIPFLPIRMLPSERVKYPKVIWGGVMSIFFEKLKLVDSSKIGVCSNITRTVLCRYVAGDCQS